MERNRSYQLPFAALPAVRIVLLMAAGIVFTRSVSPGLRSLLICLLTAGLGWAACEFALRKRHPLSAGRLATLCYLALIFLAAGAWYCADEQARTLQVASSEPLKLYEWEDIRVTGLIEAAGISRSGRNVYTVRAGKTTFPEGFEWNQTYRTRLYGSEEPGRALAAGRTITGTVRLYGFPERRNPHEFDYGNWLHRQGITAHGELDSLISASGQNSVAGWASARAAVQQNADELFGPEHAAMAKALLLGYKEELAPGTRQQFARAGLSHIMAVSGLHVGFIVAPFWLLIPFLWRNKWGKRAGLTLLSALLLGYAGITGFSASVCRASLMAWLLTYGKLFHKIRYSVNLTAAAAILLLMMNPGQLFDVGFQLSFGAVFVILLLMPEAQRLIPQRYRYGKAGGLLAIILISVVVQLGLFPILITYFGEFSVIGPVANALVVPALSAAVPAGLVFTLLYPFAPVLFEYTALPVEYIIIWIRNVAFFLGTLEGSYIPLQNRSVFLFVIWLAGIFFLASIRIPARRWKMLIALLLAVNLFLADQIRKKPGAQNLEITVLDVGQGDAIHLKTPGGKHLLIDAGRWSPLGNSGERVLLPYFLHQGIGRLDAVVLSHPHADHIGGMPDILENIPVGAIYRSDAPPESELAERYLQIAAEKGIPVMTPAAGDIIGLDPAIRIFVIGPEPDSPASVNPNNRSVALKIVYGETSFLFTGDAEAEQEQQIARRYGEFLKSDFYKAGHHASNTSSTASLLDFAKPDITAASLAFRNNFGHPGEAAVARLHQFSDEQLYTSLNGALRFASDGKTVRKVEWR